MPVLLVPARQWIRATWADIFANRYSKCGLKVSLQSKLMPTYVGDALNWRVVVNCYVEFSACLPVIEVEHEDIVLAYIDSNAISSGRWTGWSCQSQVPTGWMSSSCPTAG